MKLPRGLFLRLFRLPNFSQILAAHCQALWPQRCSISKNTFASLFYFHLKILEMWMQRLDPPERMEKRNEETVERWRYALERMVNASANRNLQGNLPFYAKVLPFVLAASFSFLFFFCFSFYFLLLPFFMHFLLHFQQCDDGAKSSFIKLNSRSGDTCMNEYDFLILFFLFLIQKAFYLVTNVLLRIKWIRDLL